MKTRRRTKGGSGETDVEAGVRRWVIKSVSGITTVALFLFLPAGRLDWWMGWALVAVWAVWQAAVYVLLRRSNPALLGDRASGPQEGDRRWDTVIMSVVGFLTMAVYVVAGLNLRFGWSPRVSARVPFWLPMAALVAVALAYALAVWAMVTNAHFSKIVRIQGDQGHKVATAGPYRFVRHPAYVGQLIAAIGAPIMLGSLWALIPGVGIALLFIVRTALEDRALQDELAGYAEYASRVRYRLLPGVW